MSNKLKKPLIFVAFSIVGILVHSGGLRSSTGQIDTSTYPPQATFVEAEVEKSPKIDKVELLAKNIEKFEGYYAGSVAFRNNNPGNLRRSPLQAGRRDGFAYFNSYEEGFEALKNQIIVSASGQSSYYHPEMTLEDFFNTYAPSADNNQPSVYLAFIIKETGFSKNMKIKELLE